MITAPTRRLVRYADGNEGRAYVGLSFGRTQWSSRTPNTCGSLQEFLASGLTLDEWMRRCSAPHAGVPENARDQLLSYGRELGYIDESKFPLSTINPPLGDAETAR